MTSARAIATRLLLAAGELARPVVGTVGEADLVERGQRPPPALAGSTPAYTSGSSTLRQRGQVGEQVELLEHEADVPVADLGELVLVEVGDVVAGQQEPAGGGDVEAAEDVHQRRLARARRSDDGDELAALDRERHARGSASTSRDPDA